SVGWPFGAYLTRSGFLTVFPALSVASLPLALLVRRRTIPGPPLAAWRAAWRRTAFWPVFGASILMALGFNAFTAWKAMIPVLHPFAWDVPLARLDQALHLGPPERLVGWLPL